MIADIDKDQTQNEELLLCAPEISVWMTAFGGLRTLAELQLEYSQQRITQKQYIRAANEALVSLVETADATHRFGVLLPATIEPHYGRRLRELTDAFLRVDFSPSFWRWFNWWQDYVRMLTISEKKHIYHLAMERVPLVDKYRPSGDWLNYRSESSLVLASV